MSLVNIFAKANTSQEAPSSTSGSSSLTERISTAERAKCDIEVKKELDGDVRIVINGTVFVLDEELAENIESQQGYPLTEIKYNIPIYHK